MKSPGVDFHLVDADRFVNIGNHRFGPLAPNMQHITFHLYIQFARIHTGQLNTYDNLLGKLVYVDRRLPGFTRRRTEIIRVAQSVHHRFDAANQVAGIVIERLDVNGERFGAKQAARLGC